MTRRVLLNPNVTLTSGLLSDRLSLDAATGGFRVDARKVRMGTSNPELIAAFIDAMTTGQVTEYLHDGFSYVTVTESTGIPAFNMSNDQNVPSPGAGILITPSSLFHAQQFFMVAIWRILPTHPIPNGGRVCIVQTEPNNRAALREEADGSISARVQRDNGSLIKLNIATPTIVSDYKAMALGVDMTNDQATLVDLLAPDGAPSSVITASINGTSGAAHDDITAIRIGAQSSGGGERFQGVLGPVLAVPYVLGNNEIQGARMFGRKTVADLAA